MTTDIIFRKENITSNIIAIFPYIIGDSKNNFSCYSSIGQHSACCYEYYLKNTKPCNDFRLYNSLFRELIKIGYNDLKIIKKINYKKLLQAIKEQWK